MTILIKTQLAKTHARVADIRENGPASMLDQCLAMYAKYGASLTHGQYIARFVNDIGLTKASAETYYQLLKQGRVS